MTPKISSFVAPPLQPLAPEKVAPEAFVPYLSSSQIPFSQTLRRGGRRVLSANIAQTCQERKNVKPIARPASAPAGRDTNKIHEGAQEDEVLPANPARGLDFLERYPRQEWVRLLVDGWLLVAENGCEEYERREPGCLDTLNQGWAFIIKALGSLGAGEKLVITESFIKNIHKVVAAHLPKAKAGNYADAPYTPRIGDTTHSYVHGNGEGMNEAENLREEHLEYLGLTDEDRYQTAFYFHCLLVDGSAATCPLKKGMMSELLQMSKSEDAEKIINKKIQEYLNMPPTRLTGEVNQFIEKVAGHQGVRKHTITAGVVSERLSQNIGFCVVRSNSLQVLKLFSYAVYKMNVGISKADNEDELFAALISSISELQQLHPFVTVNGRVFMLLLQYVLMAYGYPPATLYNPNVFFLYDKKSMIAALRKGLQDTELILSSKESLIKLHGYTCPSSMRYSIPDVKDLRTK